MQRQFRPCPASPAGFTTMAKQENTEPATPAAPVVQFRPIPTKAEKAAEIIAIATELGVKDRGEITAEDSRWIIVFALERAGITKIADRAAVAEWLASHNQSAMRQALFEKTAKPTAVSKYLTMGVQPPPVE